MQLESEQPLSTKSGERKSEWELESIVLHRMSSTVRKSMLGEAPGLLLQSLFPQEALKKTYFFSSLRSERVGDSAAGRRCLWNNCVMSRRSPEVGKR